MSNEELQKLIIDLENKERAAMQRNKEMKSENTLLRQILIDDL
jgi:hypothetical protein